MALISTAPMSISEIFTWASWDLHMDTPLTHAHMRVPS